LVLNEDADFAAAQVARRLIQEAWADLDDEHHTAAAAIAERARLGELTLFVGAGASIGAGAPSWRELLDKLGESAGLSPAELGQLSTLDARDAGALLERRLGSADALRAAVVKLTDIPLVSVTHQLLASLPVREFVTTNYDTCIEEAVRGAGHSLAVLPGDPIGNRRSWLVKLHGSVADAERIVLSRDDYMRFDAEAAALAGVVQALLLTRHMLFVGYSMSDDNFHRLMHEVRAIAHDGEERLATAVTPEPLGIMHEVWNRDVKWISSAAQHEPMPRRQAIILDLISARASVARSHLYDPSYRALFNEGELELGRALLAVSQAAATDGVDPAVRDALLADLRVTPRA